MNMDKDFFEKMVRESIDNYVENCTFEYQFRDVIREKLSSKADKLITEKLESEIQNVLNGEINTDDGWGKRKHWDSFEDLFKDKFKEKMDKDWDMRRTIEKTIEERIDQLFKARTKEITEKIQNMVLDEMIKEDNKGITQ